MRKISIWTLFRNSLFSPKEMSKYRFITIGKTIQYIFFLMILLILKQVYDTFIGQNSPANSSELTEPGTKWVLAFFTIVVSYVLYIGIVFLAISIIASIGPPIAKTLERKLPYRQSWRLAAFSLTLPIILFIIFDWLHLNNNLLFPLFLIVTLLIFFMSIKAIPKPRKRS